MRWILVFAVVAVGGCGGDPEMPPRPTEPVTPSDPSWVNRKPLLHVASPGELSVGDTITILGQQFAERVHGRVSLAFRGTFFDDKGGSQEVDYQANALQLNAGKLKWDLWPNVVFSRSGDQLGRFVGTLTATNLGNDGTTKVSDALPLTLTIKPSLIPRMVKPVGQACAAVIGDTLEATPMAFTVEAIGLRPATKEAPLTFYWTFMQEQWRVGLGNSSFDTNVAPKKGAIMLEDRVTEGRTSTISDNQSKTLLLRIGEDLIGDTRLKDLKTGEIPAQGNNMPTTVNVAVVDSTGKSVRLVIKLTIRKVADMIYDGNQRVVERLPPALVSDCIPGGDIGRDVNYHESNSESRQRGLGFNYNANVGVNAAPIPFILQLNFSAGFGVNVHETVSSDKSQSLTLNGHILPGEYAAFYRQTSKVQRVGQLVGYTVCGQTLALGQVVLTDWIFTPDLAKGQSCPPPSSLPPAGKVN